MRYCDWHITLFASALYELSIEENWKLPITDFQASSIGFSWKSGDFQYSLYLIQYRLIVKSYNIKKLTSLYEVSYDDCHGVSSDVKYLKNRLKELFQQLETLHTYNDKAKNESFTS